MKAEHHTEADLLCWHNKLQTSGLLLPNQKPNQILLVNMIWLLIYSGRNYLFSVFHVKNILGSPRTSRHWQMVAQTCNLIFGWDVVSSPLK